VSPSLFCCLPCHTGDIASCALPDGLVSSQVGSVDLILLLQHHLFTFSAVILFIIIIIIRNLYRAIMPLGGYRGHSSIVKRHLACKYTSTAVPMVYSEKFSALLVSLQVGSVCWL